MNHECPKCGETWLCEGCDDREVMQLCADCKNMGDSPKLVMSEEFFISELTTALTVVLDTFQTMKKQGIVITPEQVKTICHDYAVRHCQTLKARNQTKDFPLGLCERCKEWQRLGLSNTCPGCDMIKNGEGESKI